MKVLAFGASNSKKSINKQLVRYVTSLLSNADVNIVDLNDFELPLFSIDRENEIGSPQLAKTFIDNIADADALIISFAEHNGNYTAAYKNLLDWASRVEPKVYQSKPMILLATSPGGRGGKNVLEIALKSIPRFGGIIKGSLSIPLFNENFDKQENRICNHSIDRQVQQLVASLED